MSKKERNTVRPGERKNHVPKKKSGAVRKVSRSAGSPELENIFELKIEEIERRLASGQISPGMELYFGEELPELIRLAGKASSVTRDTPGARPKVLILPGIMGSTLGYRRPLVSLFHDTIWLDPLDVTLGNLKNLSIPSAKKVVALDPFPIVYLGLKLALESEGFEASYFPYDWRLDLGELGKSLKKKLDSYGTEKVHLAAHSMGGLVARAALKLGAKNMGTVVMMGTPNFGSYSPVLALRGVHDLAAKLSKLDLTKDRIQLTEDVFSTFPGLTQMLPVGPIANGLNWHDPALWPATPKPNVPTLKQSANPSAHLASALSNWFLIAGIDQETIVSGEPVNEDGQLEMRYRCSFAGDGTVPLASARLPELTDSQVFYVSHGHGTLTMNESVKRAVIQLLRGEKVTALSSQLPKLRADSADWIKDSQLLERSRRARELRGTTRAWGVRDATAELLDLLEAPLGFTQRSKPAPGTLPAPVDRAPLSGVVVSREKQLYLEVELAKGDISKVDCEAIVLAQFQNMDLGRAGQAVDAQMGGVLVDMVQRRMFSANVGEMFVLPTGRHPIRAEIVAIAGLGAMDHLLKTQGDLSWETLELVAENTLRTLLGAGVTEFATLLFGNLAEAGPVTMRQGLEHFMQGFLRGLADSKNHRRFRRVILCESDPKRYEILRQALLDLLPTRLFDPVQVRLEECLTLPAPDEFDKRTLSAADAGKLGRDPAYLFVRVSYEPDTIHFETTLILPNGRAAAAREVQRVSPAQLEEILEPVKSHHWGDNVEESEVDQAGSLIAKHLIHPTHRELLERESAHGTPIILVHDEEASRIPWETLRLGTDGKYRPACGPGLSRQYAAANLSVAKWMESRRMDEKLRILLIVDPTGDLKGARKEGERIKSLFDNVRDISTTIVKESEATRSRLIDLFRSGNYDIVHYAGHAFFDPVNPDRSGLICAPRDDQNPSVLTGADLAGLGQLPMLVFFNACESARVRKVGGGVAAADESPKILDNLRSVVSVAEALMRGGVANFLGTYWPVSDDAAKEFADSFYKSVIAGEPLGPCITKARRLLVEKNLADWADYLHYGSPNFVLKPNRE